MTDQDKFDAFKKAYDSSNANLQSASTVALDGKWSPLSIDNYNRLVFSSEDGRTVAFSASQLKKINGFALGSDMPDQDITIVSSRTDKYPVTSYANWHIAKKKLDAIKADDAKKDEKTSKIFNDFNAKKGEALDKSVFVHTHAANIVE